MTEWELIEYLMAAEALLPPLQCDGVLAPLAPPERANAFVTGCLREEGHSEPFNFLVEAKSRSTPQFVHQAISTIKRSVIERNDPEVFPMIIVPYLSDERLRELEEAQVSGIDLCGNGVITIPGRLLIYRTGNENRYPESRPVSNPFQGKSAMVARVFLGELVFLEKKTKFDTLGELHQAVVSGGIEISLSQVSKAASALEEERLIGSKGRSIFVLDPDRIMDHLAFSWKPTVKRKQLLRCEDRLSALVRLNQGPSLKWAITGESSVSRYTPFAQGGAVRIAVSNAAEAAELLRGKVETVPNFADLELLETDEPGFFFENQVDDQGIRWASLLQTWIELSSGDARQQEAANTVRGLIIAPPSNSLHP